MTDQIFTLGYSGRKPADILAWLNHLDADLFDIRFSPASRHPMWTGKGLKQVMGERYRHIKALGNENYKGGPIKLVDWSSGLSAIRASTRAVVLMCACGNPAECHRTTVAELLRGSGLAVNELPSGPPPLQGSLL